MTTVERGGTPDPGSHVRPDNIQGVWRTAQRQSWENCLVSVEELRGNRPVDRVSEVAAAVRDANTPEVTGLSATAYRGSVLIPVAPAGARSSMQAWLKRLRAGLDQREVPGPITVPRSEDIPGWAIERAFSTNSVTAFLAMSGPRSELAKSIEGIDGQFGITFPLPDSVLSHQLRSLAAIGETYLDSGCGPTLRFDDPPHAGDLVRALLPATRGIRIKALESLHARVASFATSLDGQLVIQDFDDRSEWTAELGRALAATRAHASLLDLGIITVSRGSVPSWYDLMTENRPPPLGTGSAFIGARHVWTDFTLDAYGAQLLTDRHLERAHDLSQWDITSVAPGRYLVVASDPEPWFRHEAPPPEVLLRARDDFGDMIAEGRWTTSEFHRAHEHYTRLRETS